MRNLTLKELRWKEKLFCQPESERIDVPKDKRIDMSTMNLPRVDPAHLRNITVVKDEGYLLDPSNFKARIPKEAYCSFYESKGKVLGAYSGVEELLKTARLKFGNKELKYVYLVTGKKIKRFGQIPNYVTQIVVSSNSAMKGVSYGNFYKDMPSSLRKKASVPTSQIITRTPSKKVVHTDRRQTVRSKTARVSTLTRRSLQRQDSYSKFRGADESIEKLRREYPLDIVTKLIITENHNKHEQRDLLNTMEIKAQYYTEKIKKITQTLNNQDTNIELNPIVKLTRRSSQSAPKISQITTQKTHIVHNDSSSISSGFESYEDENESSTIETESIHELASGIGKMRLESYRNSLLINPRFSRRDPVLRQDSGIHSASSDFIKKFMNKFGLTIEKFQLCYSDYRSQLNESSKNHNQVGLRDIMEGRYKEEANGIRLDYITTHHNFFKKMPDLMRKLILDYYKIEDVIKLEVWIEINCILIYKFSRRTSKIEFVCSFLPSTYKQIFKLLKTTSPSLERILNLLQKMLNHSCFDEEFNLDRDKLRMSMLVSDIKADEMISILTEYSDI